MSLRVSQTRVITLDRTECSREVPILKVLAVMPSYRTVGYVGSVGGGEISNRLLFQGLVAQGHEVVVVTTNAGGCGDCTESGVRIIELSESGNSVFTYVKSRLKFRYKVKKMALAVIKPDVVITSTEALGVALSLKRSAHHLPVGLFVRAYENLDTQGSLSVMLKRAVKGVLLGGFGPKSVAAVDLVLPNSEYMKQVCRRYIPDRVLSKIVYPPVDYELVPMDEAKPLKTVSMVATSAKKGTALVEGLAEKFPDLSFRMVGCPGASIDGEQVKNNLTLVGWCNVRTEFEQKADIVLVPSLWPEPFGRVAVEALVAGKIVLVSDIGGLPEAVASQKMLTLEVGSLESWSKALRCVMADPLPYYKAVEVARSQINKFGLKKQVEVLEEALKQLVTPPGR